MLWPGAQVTLVAELFMHVAFSTFFLQPVGIEATQNPIYKPYLAATLSDIDSVLRFHHLTSKDSIAAPRTCPGNEQGKVPTEQTGSRFCKALVLLLAGRSRSVNYVCIAHGAVPRDCLRLDWS